MPDLPFTSIEIESDESTDTRECAEIVAKKLSSNLDRELLWTERAELLN